MTGMAERVNGADQAHRSVLQDRFAAVRLPERVLPQGARYEMGVTSGDVLVPTGTKRNAEDKKCEPGIPCVGALRISEPRFRVRVPEAVAGGVCRNAVTRVFLCRYLVREKSILPASRQAQPSCEHHWCEIPSRKQVISRKL